MKVACRSHSRRPVSTAVGGVGQLGQRGHDEVAAGRPAAVDGGLVDAGPRGHVFDAKTGKAMLADQFEGRPQHVGDDPRATPADPRLGRAPGVERSAGCRGQRARWCCHNFATGDPSAELTQQEVAFSDELSRPAATGSADGDRAPALLGRWPGLVRRAGAPSAVLHRCRDPGAGAGREPAVAARLSVRSGRMAVAFAHVSGVAAVQDQCVAER